MNTHQTTTTTTPPPSLPELDENQNKPKTKHQYHLTSINSTILIRQIPSQGISFQLWPAATTLLNLLNNHRHQPTTSSLSTTLLPFSTTHNHKLRILELGSGTGLVGIAAAAIFNSNVTVTDLPHVLPNLKFNVEANANVLTLNGGVVDVAALRWGEREDIGNESFDVVLGSDLVYHDHLYEPLIETLKWLLNGMSEKKTVFLMAHLKRWKKESGFFKKAKKLFDVEVVHSDDPVHGCRVGVLVYRFVGKGCTNVSYSC